MRKFNRSKCKKKRRSRSSISRFELLENRQLLAGDVFQNPANAFDVNNDGEVSPSDAAAVAFYAATSGTRGANVGSGEPGNLYVDVNGDGLLDGDDLSAVIGQLDQGNGEPGDAVTFRIELLDLSGSAITEIDRGSQFDMVMLVNDTSDNAEGVFSAYLDLEYTEQLATADSITFSSDFPDSQTGDISVDGLVNEAGGLTISPSVGEKELFRVRMTADDAGQISFSTNPADESVSEILILGSGDVVSDDDVLYPSATLTVNGTQQAEDDLVAFAKALSSAGVELWTSEVNADANGIAQLELLAEGQHSLTINEVFDYDRNETGADRFTIRDAATTANVTQNNVWVWPDGSQSDGSVLTLAEISTESGVSIPQSVNPSITPIADVVVAEGGPVHIALDGYDPNGDPLTYTVSVGDSGVVDTFIPQGNRSISIPVSQGSSDLGDMVFELFEGRAPRPTQRIIELANDGFHEDIIFHRIIDQFVIQGGDPTGTGSGGSSLGDFDDQFHVDLQHTTSGLLSMAKSADDTNDSQFFITEIPTPWLDFNHSVFGLLVEGERTRQTTSNVEVGLSDKPVEDISMGVLTVFEDTENAVLMLEALGSSGSTSVTVTATDLAGNSTTETFNVTLAPDGDNDPPFLLDFDSPVFEPGETAEFQVDAVDSEGDEISYSVEWVDANADGTISVDDQGKVTASGFVGVQEADIRVTGAGSQGDDNQRFSISILPSAPTSIDLVDSADSGLSNTDNITNVTDLEFTVSGVTDGATVILLSGTTEIGQGVAVGDTATITQANTSALGSGQQTITAVVEADGLRSQASPAITIVLDQTDPVDISNTPPTSGVAGTLYEFDAEHVDEGFGEIRYSLANAPTGMVIDGSTGQLTWTPTGDQSGSQSFEVIVSDIAGNETTLSANVDVAALDTSVTLQIRNASGDSIATIPDSGQFFVDVFVEDVRADATGISSAHVDLVFDTQGIVAVDSSSSVQVSTDFSTSPQTGTVSASGIANVGGTATSPVTGRTLLATIPMVGLSTGAVSISATFGTDGIQLDGETQPLGDGDAQFFGDSIVVLGSSTELTAVDDTFAVDEDSGVSTLDVLINDTVTANGGSVTITDVGDPTNGGTATVSENGSSISYEPALDFPNSTSPGNVTIAYTISDEVGASSSATATVTVNPVNDPPPVQDDSFPEDLDQITTPSVILEALEALREDTSDPATLPILLNDTTNLELGDFLQVTEATVDQGTVTLLTLPGVGDTSVQYTPPADFFGDATISYTVRDLFDITTGEFSDGSLTADATATVTIAQVNDAPTAVADSISINSSQTLDVEAATLLDNDTAGPLEDSVQSLSITSVTQPSQAIVTLNGDGSLTIVADSDASGSDTFTYVVTDDGITEDVNTEGTGYVTREDPLTAETTVTLTYGLGEATNSRFSGRVYFDLNNDGVQGSDELGVVASQVLLTGTDDSGNAISRTFTTDSTGFYSFDDLPQGSYRVTQPQSAFLLDGDEFAVGVASADGNDAFALTVNSDLVVSDGNTFAERGLTPKLAMLDALSSNRRGDGFLTAVGANGTEFVRNPVGWDDFNNIRVEMSSDESQVTIRATNLSGQELSATVDASDKSKVSLLGRDEGTWLLRIVAAASAFDMQVDTDS